MRTITREELRRKLEAGEVAEVVEVLDEPHFRKFHLPGAINVPVHDGDFERRIQEVVPDKSVSVVVYCQDRSCQASPEAARRMEALGYQNVYDYEAGKEDWRDAGLPVET